ncbi:MAG: hypothetical protein ACRELF_25730 [Gemmataceae bacterium]
MAAANRGKQDGRIEQRLAHASDAICDLAGEHRNQGSAGNTCNYA